MTGESVNQAACELCAFEGTTVYSDDKLFVIVVDDANYPGFCRVIWRDHVREMSDLAREDRLLLNETVFHVEQAVRETMAPTKMNVASLGNMVPHLHWHIIPRFTDDPHFPNPVFGAGQRDGARPLPAAFVRSMQEKLSGLLEKNP